MEQTMVSLGWMIASLFLEEPPFALARELSHGSPGLPLLPGGESGLIKGWEGLRVYAREQSGRNSKDVHDELRMEFTRLFIGPWQRMVYPYESVYRDSLNVAGQRFTKVLMGRSVDRVLSFWAEAGVKSIHCRNYSPDHFGLEMGFMAYLGQRFLETKEERYADLARRFLHEHLLKWAPRFCSELCALEDAYFYKALAQLSKEFLMTQVRHFDRKEAQTG